MLTKVAAREKCKHTQLPRITMKKAKYHVVRRDGGWAVTKEGGQRASSIHPTQSEAVESARALAQRHSGELVVHSADGKIRDTSERRAIQSPPIPIERHENSPSMQDVRRTLPRRLKQARSMLGMSLRNLADATGGKVSHNAIARYEKGEMAPGSDALIALARALSQPLDFFLRPFRLELSGVSFRKKSVLTQTDRTSIQERALDFFERYWEVEEILGEHRPFNNPLPPSPVRNAKEIAERAKILRQKWDLGPGPLPNIHELMELNGIKVHELNKSPRNFDGFAAETPEGPVVVIADWLNGDLPRKRMTEVHELAHVVLTVPEGLSEREEENMTWDFAGELLLPEDAFRDAFGECRTAITLGELIRIKALFGASIMAIVRRADKLGIISKQAAKKFWIFANKSKWRKEGEPGSDAFRGDESYSRFRTLVYRAVAEEKISISKGAAFLHTSIDELRRKLLTENTFN